MVKKISNLEIKVPGFILQNTRFEHEQQINNVTEEFFI